MHRLFWIDYIYTPTWIKSHLTVIRILSLFQSQYKKYSNGHKVVWAPYSKAVESLKKFRKKSRNKPMFEDQKESQVHFFICEMIGK